MMVREETRLRQGLSGTMVNSERAPRRRAAGRRFGGRDDLGREVMPFDVIVGDQRGEIAPPDLAGEMIAAFGGRAWR
jgi:hypothetical protein